MTEFLNMGGYGFYVWGSFGMAALVIVLELSTLRARRRRTLDEARLGSFDTLSAIPASEPVR